MASVNATRLKFEDIQTVFVRANITGKPSLKNRPFAFFKSEHKDTNFYDDLHEIYKQLLKAETQARAYETKLLVTGYRLSSAFGDLHPILTRAGEIARAFHEEAQLIPHIWHRFTMGKWNLTPVQNAYYSPEQVEYRPMWMPGDSEETERPFMSLIERKEDDIARAEQRAAELGGR